MWFTEECIMGHRNVKTLSTWLRLKEIGTKQSFWALLAYHCFHKVSLFFEPQKKAKSLKTGQYVHAFCRPILNTNLIFEMMELIDSIFLHLGESQLIGQKGRWVRVQKKPAQINQQYQK